MSKKQRRAIIVPLCQIVGCEKPLVDHRDRNYIWVEINDDTPTGQIVICNDCLKRFEDGAKQPCPPNP